MKKFLSFILIFAGIGIMLYPYLEERYQSYKQEKLLADWEETIQSIDDYQEISGEDQGGVLEVNDGQNEPAVNESTEEETRRKEEEQKKEEEKRQAEKKWLDEYIGNHMDGILTIEKINLRLPVLAGATKENMGISIASIDGTGKPGSSKNYCIAGHRNHTYGRNFNRLNELEVGDVINMEYGKNTYRYEVFEKFLVDPGEIWVLYKTRSTESEITLITCDPMINPTHRLIVKGRLQDNKNNL